MAKIISFDGEHEFLSNFHFANITHDGILFPTNEHAFQAAKTFDVNDRIEISKCATPGRAKRMGRMVQLRPDWEDVKISVMWEICLIKFITHGVLRQKLLQTGDIELIEGNNWGDRIWGMVDGEGENLLGKILMDIRSRIK
jgi:ribA/ribD-fused uncharacterized protein